MISFLHLLRQVQEKATENMQRSYSKKAFPWDKARFHRSQKYAHAAPDNDAPETDQQRNRRPGTVCQYRCLRRSLCFVSVDRSGSVSMKLPETSVLPTTGKRWENAKKRGFQPEKSGGSPASTHKKPLICPFWEKTSMENHFEFWALKGPKTRMNTDKNRVDI